MTAYCTLKCCTAFGLAHLWGRVTFQTKNARSGRASLDMKIELTDLSLPAHPLFILGAVFFLDAFHSMKLKGRIMHSVFTIFITKI